jgi:hypothetical protein
VCLSDKMMSLYIKQFLFCRKVSRNTVLHLLEPMGLIKHDPSQN